MATQTKTICNGINMDDLMKTIRAMKEDAGMAQSHFRIRNKWLGGGHNRTTVGKFYSAKGEHEHGQTFKLDADEPPLLAGTDQGANPVEHLLNALAGCMTSSMVYHAAVNGIHIEELESEIEGDIDLRGFTGLDPNVRKGYQNIRVRFHVKADTDDMEKLESLAGFSPVFDICQHGTNVEVEVVPK